MSTYSNQAIHGGPSAPGRKNITGANSTYRSAVQKAANDNGKKDGDKEYTKAKEATRKTGAPKNPVAITVDKPRAAGFGDGHYVPNKRA